MEEDAVAPEFDYGGGSARVRLVQRFEAMNREMTFRAGAEYELRDYNSPTPSIAAPREDKRTLVDLSLEAPLGDHLVSEASYRFGDYTSNLSSADYDEHVGAIRVGVRY